MVSDSKGSGTERAGRRGERLVVLALVGVLTLNYPLLALFNDARLVFGIPMLYLYLFLVWGVLIGLGAWVLEARGPLKERLDAQFPENQRD